MVVVVLELTTVANDIAISIKIANMLKIGYFVHCIKSSQSYSYSQHNEKNLPFPS